MTSPETPDRSTEDSPRGAVAAEAPPEPEAAPEPWTAERVVEWNNYYDLYVMLGVLLLVFAASANKISQSTLWTQLEVGRMIAAKAAPVTTDPFSYTRPGARWVNVPWLYEWGQALIHQAAYRMTPGDRIDRKAWADRADQVAAGTLVAINALARVLTALVLLGIRRAGPGRWWSAVCVTLALGAIVAPASPVVVMIGGLAKPAAVSPNTWGVLLLAIEVWLLYRAIDFGRPRSAYALVPLFALWANVDESFLVGLAVLAACAIGRAWVPRRAPSKVKGEPEPIGALGLPAALIVLAASAAACLANPSFAGVFDAAAAPFLGLLRPAGDALTPDRLSVFSEVAAGAFRWYFLGIVALGFASFALNRRRFSLSRLLMYAVAAAAWGMLLRYSAEFAVVFAATLALNGQEWYHDAYGTAGRLGSGWSLWSVGGRAVTILLVFACVAKVLLGGLPVSALAASDLDPQFGFGYDRDDFAFEAADFLKDADFKGNVLNTLKAEGDALIWRAYPARKVYIDNRANLYPPGLFNRLQETSKALRDDAVAAWKPLLDEYGITAVMVPASSSRTYQKLRESEHWVPFYDDGAVAIFGRADAPAEDLAYFRAHRLDPEAMAYRKDRPIPSAERPPTPVTWMDVIFQSRRLAHLQPHVVAGQHWLMLPAGATGLPDPARCLMAIREARTALAAKPDDNTAFRLLAGAYRVLLIQEMALMSGMKLTPENAEQIGRIAPRAGVLPARFRQLLTAMNYAIQTTPPPKTAEERADLRRMNVELYQILLGSNYLDLARDRLQAVYDQSPPEGDFTANDRAMISRDLAGLNERVKQVEEQMTTISTEQTPLPADLARFALNQGAPGLAIRELEEAEKSGTSPMQVKPLLLDLYCDTGQPDKAVEMLSSGTIDDPTFGTEPGASTMRQGWVYYLLGNYDFTATLWEKHAILRLRYDRASKALGAASLFLKGDARFAVGEAIQIPSGVARQADWEFDAALCLLEGGIPGRAAEHFANALRLAPKLATRPIAAYYLEKLGKPVPPPPEAPKARAEDGRGKDKDGDRAGDAKAEDRP